MPLSFSDCYEFLELETCIKFGHLWYVIADVVSDRCQFNYLYVSLNECSSLSSFQWFSSHSAFGYIFSEFPSYAMDNKAIQDLQRDSEVVDEEGEQSHYSSDEVHAYSVDEAVGASNLDMEADNGAKLSDLVISDNTEEESTYDLSKESAFQGILEEGEVLSDISILVLANAMICICYVSPKAL